MSPRPLRRRFGGAARILVALPLLAAAASAGALHLALSSSEPAAGARLDRAPTELRLTFTEPVETPTARIVLRAPDGRAIQLAPPRHGDDGSRVLVAVLTAPLTTAGRYTVEWRAVGRDGHPVAGDFQFDVADDASGLLPPAPDAVSPTPLPPESPTTGATFDTRSPLYVGIRWLGYLALVPLLGTLAYRWLMLPRLAHAPELRASTAGAEQRLHRWARGLSALFVVTLVLRVVAQLAALHGSRAGVSAASLFRLLETTWGHAWLLQLAGALTILVALALSRTLTGWSIATVAALPIVVGAGLASHAAAAESLAPLLVAAHALHVAAAGGWLGSLLMLLAVGAPSLIDRGGSRGVALSRLVNAFSPVALACAALLVVSGAGAAIWHVGSLTALTTSAYGRTLALKLALLVPVLALGAYNWRRVRPTLHEQAEPGRALARTAGGELAFALAVLAVTAVLVATPPPGR